MIPAWQKMRSDFNHDWLKNCLMPRLASWINLLDGKIEDDNLEREFLTSVLPQWQVKRHQAVALLEDFEAQMSPLALFSQEPLSRSSEETKAWLGPLVHALWLARYQIRELLQTATESLHATDDAYRDLQNAISRCANLQSAADAKPHREAFARFRAACQRLGDAVNLFPNEIKVT